MCAAVNPPQRPLRTYEYRGSTAIGQYVTGTIDAADLDTATQMLRSMQVNVVEIGSAGGAPATRKLTGVDFLAFNEQLAAMTRAGLPVERGLRLIAHEMRDKRMAQTIRDVADEAERGTPLGEAFNKHRGKFPPLYGKLIDAGVHANNLPAMLLSLGRHMSLVRRLRAALWNALAYPAVVLLATFFVAVFIGTTIFPGYEKLISDFNFDIELPILTRVIMKIGAHATAIAVVSCAVLVLLPLIWYALRKSRLDGYVTDGIGLQLPLLGHVLRHGMIARWCDAVRLGVIGGFDLPEAIRVADEAIGSPALAHDGKRLVSAITSGMNLGDARGTLVIGESVAAPLDIAIRTNNLAQTLEMLSDLHERQAEGRIAVIITVLPAILLAVMSVVIGTIIFATFMPMMELLRMLTMDAYYSLI